MNALAGLDVGASARQSLVCVLHIFLLAAVTLVASLFPTHPLSMVAYLGAILFAVVTGISTVRNASPAVQRQALLASLGALLVALGAGTFIYLR